jgi:hypothetical protein
LYEVPYPHWQIVSAEGKEIEVGKTWITPYINVYKQKKQHSKATTSRAYNKNQSQVTPKGETN